MHTLLQVQRGDKARMMEPREARGHPLFPLSTISSLVDGEHDVFGDGKVILIPTYGALSLASDTSSCVTAAELVIDGSSPVGRLPATA